MVAFWGQSRLSDATAGTVPDVRLRLVQPNIKQENKWDEAKRELNFAKLLELSSVPNGKPVTHIIWPESAATFYLAEDPEHRQEIGQFVPDGGAVITGVIRREMSASGTMSFYNSLMALDEKADIIAVYDKHHLVPYGEYVPFRDIIPLHAVAGLGLDFHAGSGTRSIRLKGLPPFSPLICYEAIFSGEVAARDDRPDFLLNVTNDGWYGRSTGPYQHFAMTRVRAIEEGLPLVRDANTGISGVFDAYGRVTAKLDLGKTGTVDADLPRPLPPTYFVRMGSEILWFLFAALALTMIFLRRSVKS